MMRATQWPQASTQLLDTIQVWKNSLYIIRALCTVTVGVAGFFLSTLSLEIIDENLNKTLI